MLSQLPSENGGTNPKSKMVATLGRASTLDGPVLTVQQTLTSLDKFPLKICRLFPFRSDRLMTNSVKNALHPKIIEVSNFLKQKYRRSYISEQI